MAEEKKDVPENASQAWQLLKISAGVAAATMGGYMLGANPTMLAGVSGACSHFYHLAAQANTDPTAVDALTRAALACNHTRSFTSVVGACAGFFTSTCGAVCLGCSRRKVRKRNRRDLEEDENVVPLPRPLADKKQATNKERVRNELNQVAQRYECKNSDQLLSRLYDYDEESVAVFNAYLNGAPDLPAACAAFFNLYVKGQLFFKPLGRVLDRARYNLTNVTEEQAAIVIPAPRGTFRIVRPNGTLLQEVTARQVLDNALDRLTTIHFLKKAGPENV